MTYFAIYLLLYYFSLRFIFPGYFSPYVPHHSDILDYPYDLMAGGLAGLASRPTGLVLNAFFGLFFSWKGIVTAGVFCVIGSMLLMIDIIWKETGRRPSGIAVVAYGLLVFTAPTFYLNYSFDIFGTYALVIGLAAIRFSLSKRLRERPILLCSSYFFIMLLGFLSKETYIISFCFYRYFG